MGILPLGYLKCDAEELNFRILILSGFWPLDTNKKWLQLFHSVYSYLCTFSIVSMMFIQILDIYLLRNDPLTLVKNLSSTGMTLMCVLKYLYFLLKIKEINQLKEDLRSIRESRQEPEEVEVFQRANKLILNSTKAFYSLAVPCVIVWIIYPAMDVTEYKRLPFPYRLPVDIKKSPVYEIVYVYHSLSIIGYLTNIVSFDLVFYGFVLQVNSIYDLLIKDFEKMTKIVEDSLQKNNNENYVGNKADKMLQEIIKKNCLLQKRIFGQIRQLRKIFGIPGLLTFMSLINQIGMIVIDILLFNQGLSLKLMHRLMYAMCGLLDTFLWSYYGSTLNEKSDETTRAAYSVPWYNMSLQTKKKIQMIITNSRRPPVLSLGDFIPLNLHSFLQLMKLSYNITALLRESIKKQ